MRRAGRELLSLALMDARNHTLHLLAHFEQALGKAGWTCLRAPELELPLWLAGHIGWLAEYWIGRNPQRALGAGVPGATGAAGVDRTAGRPLVRSRAGAARGALAAASCRTGADVRAYLLDTLESTLELLDKTAETTTRACTSSAWRCFTRTCAASSW